MSDIVCVNITKEIQTVTRRPLAVRVTVRFMGDDAEDILEAAENSGQTISAWMRHFVIQEARTQLSHARRNPRPKRSAHHGT